MGFFMLFTIMTMLLIVMFCVRGDEKTFNVDARNAMGIDGFNFEWLVMAYRAGIVVLVILIVVALEVKCQLLTTLLSCLDIPLTCKGFCRCF